MIEAVVAALVSLAVAASLLLGAALLAFRAGAKAYAGWRSDHREQSKALGGQHSGGASFRALYPGRYRSPFPWHESHWDVR